jgi:tetratricopeptide (TPR) repeat protein
MAPMVHYNLGGVLFQKGQLDDAVAHYTKALQLQPDFANAHLNLGAVLFRKRLLADAVAHWEKALAIAPQSTVTLNKLALILATCSDARIRNGSRAIQLAEQADRLSDRKSPAIVRTLAAAYAEGGRFTDAIDAAERAQELALEQGNSALADESRMDIDLYRMNFPKHESGLNP